MVIRSYVEYIYLEIEKSSELLDQFQERLETEYNEVFTGIFIARDFKNLTHILSILMDMGHPVSDNNISKACYLSKLSFTTGNLPLYFIRLESLDPRFQVAYQECKNPTSMTNLCIYDHRIDSAHDFCLYCGQPEERK